MLFVFTYSCCLFHAACRTLVTSQCLDSETQQALLFLHYLIVGIVISLLFHSRHCYFFSISQQALLVLHYFVVGNGHCYFFITSQQALLFRTSLFHSRHCLFLLYFIVCIVISSLFHSRHCYFFIISQWAMLFLHYFISFSRELCHEQIS